MPTSSSPLFAAVPDTRRYPPLTGTYQADVAVIGGGMIGVMTAWRLAQLGRRVALLEQNNLATGDTGFTTSFITRVPDTALAGLEKKYGVDFVRQLIQATADAQSWLEQTILAEQLDCDFVRCSSFNCTSQPGDPRLQAEWRVAQLVDSRAAFVTSETDAHIRSPLTEAIRFDGEGHFNVRKFIFGLLQRPSAKNIRVFEGSPVTDVHLSTTGAEVVTERGRVQATRVIVCTGKPPAFFSELQPLVQHQETFVLTAEYDQVAPIPNHLFWDTDEPYHYWRRINDRTILMGGADRADHQASTVDPHQALEQFVGQQFPGFTRVTDRWAGSLFTTSDGLPIIASHPRHPKQLLFATGFAGNGMVMGALAGAILAEAATGQAHSAAKLFGLGRIGARIGHPSRPTAKHSAQPARWWPWIICLIGLLALAIPAVVFFGQRSSAFWSNLTTFQAFSGAIFPLFGLYAFTLVWIQVMIGSNMDLIRRVFPALERYHKIEGVFVFLFAWTHPTLLLISVGLARFWPPTFISPQLAPYVYLGEFQFFLINLTVLTALLRKTKLVKKYWHTIHLLNYLTFTSIWIHSWFLGTDVRSTSLRYVWMLYAVAVIGSLIGRVTRARTYPVSPATTPVTPQVAPASQPEPAFVKVAETHQVTEGHPFCADINGQPIMIIKFGEKFYALNNTCSHQGGPLCEGVQDGQTIECPWHGSVFDVTSGAVKHGPARVAQRSYPVKISGTAILISSV